jgi:hypothetical protein
MIRSSDFGRLMSGTTKTPLPDGTGHADGSFHIRGLLDMPSKPGRTPSLVSVDELRGRVNEFQRLATRFREIRAEVLALKG